MSRELAALAARAVGRRIRLTTGQTGTIVRVTSRGYVVKLEGVTARDVSAYLDD